MCACVFVTYSTLVDLLKRAGLKDGSQQLVAGPSGQKDAYFVQKPTSVVFPEQEWSALGSNFSMRMLLNVSVNTDAMNSSDITTIVSVGNLNVSLTTKTGLFINLMGKKYTIPVNFAAGFQNISIDIRSPGYMFVYVNCFGFNVTLSSSIVMVFATGSTGTLTIADPAPLIVGRQFRAN